MAIQDVRQWIQQVEDLGELTRVDGVDPHLELGGLVDLYQWDMENPALLFDHLKGHQPGYRVLANVFTSMRRVSLSLNMPIGYGRQAFVQAWRQRLKELKPVPAELVQGSADLALLAEELEAADTLMLAESLGSGDLWLEETLLLLDELGEGLPDDAGGDTSDEEWLEDRTSKATNCLVCSTPSLSVALVSTLLPREWTGTTSRA